MRRRVDRVAMTTVGWMSCLGIFVGMPVGCDAGGTGGGATESGASDGDGDGDGGRIEPVDEADWADATATALCGAQFDCACDPATTDGVDACVSVRSTELATRREMAVAAGLTYDPACSIELQTRLRDLACGADAGAGDTCASCSAYHGDRDEGEACEPIADGFSDCARGLTCADGTCLDPCAPPGVIAGEGEACDSVETFCDQAADLYCDASMICVAPPNAGEPCPAFLCASTAWCNTNDPGGPICLPKYDIDGICSIPAACLSGTCDPERSRCVPAPPLVCAM